jgi:hypothetical protein
MPSTWTVEVELSFGIGQGELRMDSRMARTSNGFDRDWVRSAAATIVERSDSNSFEAMWTS